MTGGVLGGPSIPATEHAIQIVEAGRVAHNRDKAVPLPGPYQLILRMEACGLCFSDTKLLHAFTKHPRKGPVLSGLDAEVLAEIPSYTPGPIFTVPGHEAVGRIVAVGDRVSRHEVGERCLVQTDYRHLLTAGANAAFGYNFEGGLQQYVLLDERMIIERETDERFLIPVGEEPSASAVALVEPWACVEASYVNQERNGPLTGRRLLFVADEGHTMDGLAEVLDRARPAQVTAILADAAQRQALEAPRAGAAILSDIASLPSASFEDIVYFGADADRLESLQDCLAFAGLLNVVTGGVKVDRPVAVDVGRVHYDLTRWTGTLGNSATEGYVGLPADGEVRSSARPARWG
jgi:hypothetical protein